MKINPIIKKLCNARKRMGAKRYGPKAYLDGKRDMYQEAEQELIDFINYLDFQSEIEPKMKQAFRVLQVDAANMILALRLIKL